MQHAAASAVVLDTIVFAEFYNVRVEFDADVLLGHVAAHVAIVALAHAYFLGVFCTLEDGALLPLAGPTLVDNLEVVLSLLRVVALIYALELQ